VAAYLDELNPDQRQAAAHADGPVLVIAGAGTGKTKTLACRVAYLIDKGTPPDRILLLTFTRRAAAEMLTRAARSAGTSATGKVWGGTFHAIANRLLRTYGRAIGLVPEFTVIDQADAADLMNLIRNDLGLAKTNRRFPRKSTLVAIYSRLVNARIKLSALLEQHYPWCHDERDGIKQIIEAYTQRKRAQQVLDYDDLLLYWRALLAAPVVGDQIADRFAHILVDEYQDTNIIQAEILQQMRCGNPNLMVVGDDAQSIYSFRAATVRNILDFPAQFPGASIVKLQQNYRSVQPILAASNAVMAQAVERYTKDLFTQRPGGQKPTVITCFDEAEQTTEVCTRILEQREAGIALRRQAVLFRAGHHSDMLEVELTRRNIPFVKYGGLKFVEAAHVKDMLALLRLLENPRDQIGWFRVLQLLPGIGPASAARFLVAMGLRDPAPGQDALPSDGAVPVSAPSAAALLARAGDIPPAARDPFAALRQAVGDCLGESGLAGGGPQESLSPASTIERLRRFYDPIVHRLYENPVVRLRDLEQLEQIATRYKSRSQFITDITLDPPSSTQDLAGPPLLDEDWLTLSTIHSAKGMEWDAVHILHAADGMIPSDMATGSQPEIDEERRLLYVAMTRAKDFLYFYFPLRYYHRSRGQTDRHSYAQLTRFIPSPPSPAAALFERQSGPQVRADEAAAAPDCAAPTAAKAVDDLLKDLLA